MKKSAARGRRTQAERREETVRKLIVAAVDALVELGYAGASVKEICTRAGVSQGGLFRHFDTREALMVAVGEELGRAQIAAYRRDLEAASGTGDPLETAIRLVRERCRSRLNMAWYELAMAARTQPALREAMAPVADGYIRSIEALARELLPDLANALGDRFGSLVSTVIAVFDGESLHGFVSPASSRSESGRVELLASFVHQLARA